MAEKSYFMGKDGFVWFTGVVEDRNDPELLGRVRVRCVGYHTDNITEIPTSELPWAHVMHPVTDPSMQGMGNTPSFLVEGTWVVGFFRDAEDQQQPIILGSLPGTPKTPSDPRFGFNDPRGESAIQSEYEGKVSYGPYPVDEGESVMPSGHSTGEPDTNRLAQGETSESHNSLIARRKQRLRGDPTKTDTTVGVDDNSTETDVKGTGIPKATKPYLKSVSDAAEEETRGFWNEPDPKSIKKNANPYVSSQYPYNHVHESESGHIREIDDSPGHERLFTQHRSGTFEEIHPNGNKVVKVIGDNYEIVAGSSNVSITGSVNITVEGTVRELIKGDYILEVEGNYTQKIHKNHLVKVGAGESGGNREEEIRGNHAQNINGYRVSHIGGYDDLIIEETRLTVINDTDTLGVVNDIFICSMSGSINAVADQNLSTSTISGITAFKSGGALNMKSVGAMTIHSESTLTETVDSNVARTTTGTHTHKFTGESTNHYVSAFKEKMDGDHYVDKETGKTDHTHTVSPARSSGTDAVTGL
jgi:hypothetical protein